MAHGYDIDCTCNSCMKQTRKYINGSSPHRSGRSGRSSGRRSSNWSAPMGGGDSAGNPVTVAFGTGPKNEGHTLIGDGDRSEGNFLASPNHDHYGSGSGPNRNGTRRGQYSGPGS